MRRTTALLALALGVLTPELSGQVTTPLTEYSLPNGLRVFLAEDHSAPVVTVSIWYNVGSRNEVAGKTGLAHLFEHLMFRGSEHVSDGQHHALVEAAGGDASANTSEDRTAYSQTLPSNQLALGLWLEADRMRSLKLDDPTLANQRQQIQQERQARVEQQAYGAAFLEGLTAAFDSTSCPGYTHSVMGSLEDLESASIADVQAFYRRYYVPNRATLVIAGDLDATEARRLVQSYFADIPRGPAVTPVTCAVNYAVGARSQQWQDAMAQLPAVIVTYRVPAHSDPDARPLQLLSIIAGQGEGSRLYSRLVRDEKVAVQSTSGIETRGGPGLLYAYAIVAPGATVDSAQHSLAAQVARLSTDVTQAELDRAKVQVRAISVANRQTTAQLADEVQHFAHYHGAPAEIDTDLARFAAVTLADVKRVAAKYLVPQNSSTLIVNPPGRGGEPAGGHQHEEEE